MLKFRLPVAIADEVSDAELLRRFRAGDDTAFALLVRRHATTVRAACRVHQLAEADADDVFQNTFLALVRQADRVTDCLGGWLYRVAERSANRLRRQHRTMPLPDELPQLSREPFADASAVLDEVARLPEKYRQAVAFCYLAGKTTADAAAELGWAKGTVLTRLAWARKRLQDRLTRRGLALSLVAVMVNGQLVEATVSASRRVLDAPSPVGFFSFFNTWKDAMTVRNVLVAAGLMVAVAVGFWSNAEAGAETPKPPKATTEVPKANAAEKPKWIGTWVRESTTSLREGSAEIRAILEIKSDSLTMSWEMLNHEGTRGGGSVTADYAAHRGSHFFGAFTKVSAWEKKKDSQDNPEKLVSKDDWGVGQPFAVKFAVTGEQLEIQNIAAFSYNVVELMKYKQATDSVRFFAMTMGQYRRIDDPKKLPPLKMSEPPTDEEVLKALNAKPDRKFEAFRDGITIVKTRVKLKGDDGQEKPNTWECKVYRVVPSDPPGSEINQVEVVYIEK